MTKDKLHVGIIMDGNRRFAKRLMLEPRKGHEYGAKKFEEILDWCEEASIGELTLYTLSLQNLNRPKHELDYLMNLFRKEFDNFLNKESKAREKGLRIRYIGRLDLLPSDIQEKAKEVEEKTKDNTGFKLNFCFAYGGREELIDAIYHLGEDIKAGKVQPTQIDEDLINNYLLINSEPDFIIRTGGEIRTSNFMPWQSVYSEWFFVDKLWPEFDKEDFDNILKEFKSRERRFGK